MRGTRSSPRVHECFVWNTECSEECAAIYVNCPRLDVPDGIVPTLLKIQAIRLVNSCIMIYGFVMQMFHVLRPMML